MNPTQIFSIADIFTSALLVCLFSVHLILNTMDGTPVFEKPENTAPNDEIIFYNKVLTFCIPGDAIPDPTKVPSRHTVNDKLGLLYRLLQVYVESMRYSVTQSIPSV
ncbi:hypothetical protein Ocin01_04962 [Orchesella cincta]|uniref:Uncharacterized protein n=1 Tax=Orchesella cincta TaxID=48709 RepID=A0A1D2N9G6_ORCCI|nr:hypothetical protein Ocin01_04962 [Orchesella cincta]